jgi:hypothetical protein
MKVKFVTTTAISSLPGTLAEELCSGLQNHVSGCDS